MKFIEPISMLFYFKFRIMILIFHQSLKTNFRILYTRKFVCGKLEWNQDFLTSYEDTGRDGIQKLSESTQRRYNVFCSIILQ